MRNTINNIEATEQNNANDHFEKCVICGADTAYKISTPISQRKYYVEGSGQICTKCHFDLYVNKNR